MHMIYGLWVKYWSLINRDTPTAQVETKGTDRQKEKKVESASSLRFGIHDKIE
jgi:hypothetical protein